MPRHLLVAQSPGPAHSAEMPSRIPLPRGSSDSRSTLSSPATPDSPTTPGSPATPDAPATPDSYSTLTSRLLRSPIARVGADVRPPPANRTAAWMGGLVLGAILLLVLGLSPAAGSASPTGPAYGASDALGGDSGLIYADQDIVAGKELSAAEAAKRLAQLRASRASRAASGAQASAATAPPAWVDPVPTARLTSCFCARWGTFHWGIDLAAPIGTPIMAAGDGVVLKAGPASGFGNAIYIQHENGDVTVYGHEYVVLVEAGDIVRAGDVIAKVGSEGQSTGPHLHLEVHVGGLEGNKIDPITWLAARGVTISK